MDVGGNGTELLFRLMEATTKRAEVIAGNVANQNTPGYTRKTLQFENKLKTALARGERLDAIAPEVREDRVTPARADGNNVSLEVELNAMRENRLMYETYTTILYGHFNLLDHSITAGN